ncbi:MAG: hypothetical protein ACFCUX_08215 [Candidatus Methylacidiphilales bacterium]
MTEENAAYDSRAKEIIAYTYLHALSNDDVIDEHELEFLKKIALKDGVIDDDEARVIHEVLGRVNMDKLSPSVHKTIDQFCALFPREKYLQS